MLKILLKKQFLEMSQTLFRSRKTGKMRSRGGTVGILILFALLFLSIAALFYGYADQMCSQLVVQGKAWLFFAMMGLMALFIGIIGSVFNTYAGLYKAKDNELLLSMPIPPSSILISRMVAVYAMSLLFSGIIWVPSVLRYLIGYARKPLEFVFPILLVFILPFLVTVLTCLLGWAVAQVASRIRKKNAATVISSLVFLAVYYVVYFKLNSIIRSAIENSDAIGRTMMTWGYPLYRMGLAATGDVVSMVLFTILCVALFALVCYLMSRSFLRISSGGVQAKAAVYREKKARQASAGAALVRRELRRFTGTPIYCLNAGLGVVFVVGLTVLALVKAGMLKELLEALSASLPGAAQLLPLALAGIACLILGMDIVTAPSISLEGKSLWLVQSMPVRSRQVLASKMWLHMLINMIPGIVCLLVLGIVFRIGIVSVILMILLTSAFVLLIGAFGLIMDLKRPNLTWTSETIPVKQNLGVLIGMFLGWVLAAAILVGGWFLNFLIAPEIYLLAVTVILAVVDILLLHWIRTRGAAIFATL